VSPTGAAIAVILTVLLAWRGNWRKPTIFLAIIAAAGVGGLGGTSMLADLAARVGNGITSLSSGISIKVFGVDMPYMIPLVLVVLVLLDLRRGATATNITLLAAVVAVWSMSTLQGPAGDTVKSSVTTVAEWGTQFFEGVMTDPTPNKNQTGR
jgi:hypothetical protein